MANKRISDLDALSGTPANGDLIEVVDISDTSEAATGTNKKATRAEVIAGLTKNADTDVSGNGWVLDEDDMASDSDEKVPTQQSVKKFVEDNAGSSDGWIPYAEVVPTRASADDPTFVLTFAGVDLTGIFSEGGAVQFTQNGATVNAFISKDPSFSTNTTLTIYGGNDYDVLDTGSFPITNFKYTPPGQLGVGFPLGSSVWDIEVTDSTSRTASGPTQDAWNNLGSISIDMPIGCWLLQRRVTVGVRDSSTSVVSAFVTLSTANNTESDSANTAYLELFTDTSEDKRIRMTINDEYPYHLTTKDTYYLNTKTDRAGITELSNNNDLSNLILRLKCCYL